MNSKVEICIKVLTPPIKYVLVRSRHVSRSWNSLVEGNEFCIGPSGEAVEFIFKWAIPRPLFLYFRLFNTQLTVNNKQMFNININFCRWLDSNRGPLASEATTLPTEPQPLPKLLSLCQNKIIMQHLYGNILSFWPICVSIPSTK